MPKAKVVAKGKKKQKIQDAAEEAELAQANLDRTPVVEAKSSAKPKIPTKDIIEVMTDTLEEAYYELSPRLANKRLYADETARFIAGSLIYGMHGFGDPVTIKETEVKAYYCSDHKN